MGLLSGLTSGFGLLGVLKDNENKKTAKKATAAITAAEDKNRALYQDIYNQTRADLTPYNQAGRAALDAQMRRFGLNSPQQPQRQPASPGGYVASPGAQAAAMSGPQGAPMASMGSAQQPSPYGVPDAPQSGPDWAAYLQQNPDVAENAQQRAAAEGIDPLTVAQQHYEAYGQTENRALPMTPAQADPFAPESFDQRPDALQAPTFNRGPDVQFQDYGQGPQVADFIDPSKFQVDPGYQFRLSEGLNSVNAASAARGKLRSGDAAKALQQRGEGLANQGYNDWYQRQLQAFNASRGTFQDNRNFGNDQSRYVQNRGDRNFLDDRSYGTNLWDTQQNRQDNIFSEDRGFAANRYDTQTNNLFNLTNMGQNAAAGTASAGNVFAGNVAQSNNNVANTQANGALWRQGQRNNMFGSAMNIAGTFAGGGF